MRLFVFFDFFIFGQRLAGHWKFGLNRPVVKFTKWTNFSCDEGALDSARQSTTQGRVLSLQHVIKTVPAWLHDPS